MNKIECTDYDSMGNYGRFPITKKYTKRKSFYESIKIFFKKKK